MTMTMNRLPQINVPDHIENVDAYIKAAQARILGNRWKGNRKRWLERSPESAPRCIDFLLENGEFEPTQVYEDGEWISSKPHPLVKLSYGEFYSKMRASMDEYGSLTEGQEKAVLGMIERAEKRLVEQKEKRAAEAAGSNFVGKIGERRIFETTVTFVAGFEGTFGYVNITGMKDDAGNVIIQKGIKLAEKGERIKFKATIKSHSERDGIKQTIVNRPKLEK